MNRESTWQLLCLKLEDLLIKFGIRKQLTGQELCQKGRHDWPLSFYATSMDEEDPTAKEEAKIHLGRNWKSKELVAWGMVQWYIQKGTQTCRRDGCGATRKVYREISLDVFCGGSQHDWQELTPAVGVYINSLPGRGENPVLNGGGVRLQSSVFGETAASN